EKIAEAKPTPFKPSREKPAETTTAASAEKDKKPETTVAKPVVIPKTETAGVSWTPETVQLIGEELKDATPEERAEWHEHLKRVDPAVIPDILRARRLTRQVSQAAQQDIKPVLDRGVTFQEADRTASTAPDRGFTLREREAGGVQPVGFSNAPTSNRVTQAGYQTPEGVSQRVDFASHQSAPKTGNDPVVLQGYVIDDGGPASDLNRNSPPAIGGTSLPRASTTPEPAASIAWPPPSNKTPAATGPAKTASSLPFGSGFVQNVVGLVPNRGNTVTPAANTVPAPLTAAARNPGWGSELERTIAALEQEVATLKPTGTPEAQNDYLRKHLALRQLYLLTDRQERALTAIPGIDPADQEFWQQVFWGMSNYLDVQHIPRPQDRATQTISQMNTAIRRLQEQADLQIRNVAFCRAIQYFGNYERFPRDEFRPGQEVLLYAEVENFKSEPTADGQYRTLLRSTIEILSPNGDLRKQIDFAATEDLCRNYRRDYFHNYQFTIPDRIPLGPHTLKLTVFDELSGRMVSYTANFNVQ
ncbi:MAG TPA: hypothetical protein VFG20_01910, partial [Planctomycetaceae bacterium]|nr:hypothetical protein [Planctomycetaceae bacterium]